MTNAMSPDDGPTNYPFSAFSYMKTPPDRATIERLVSIIEDPVEDLVRMDANFRKLGLVAGDYVDNPDAVVDLLEQRKALMQRPLIVRDGRAVVGRPKSRVTRFLGGMREPVPDTRNDPSIPPGRPGATENAKNIRQDPYPRALPQPPPPRLRPRSSLPERVGFDNMIPAPVRSVPDTDRWCLRLPTSVQRDCDTVNPLVAARSVQRGFWGRFGVAIVHRRGS